jgi:DNA-3-methyladenine glycosylase
VNRREILPIEFFQRTAPEVARDLLGAVLISHVGPSLSAGIIVETEAYLGFSDAASHAWRGRRNRQNEGIYFPPGSWYVYRSYGVHWCANLVCGPPGLGAAVLLRALELLEGEEVIRQRRTRDRTPLPVRALLNGPGKLCQGLGITRTLDRTVMLDSPVRVARGSRVPDREVRITPRIGITRAAELPLRFVVRGSSGDRGR